MDAGTVLYTPKRVVRCECQIRGPKSETGSSGSARDIWGVLPAQNPRNTARIQAGELSKGNEKKIKEHTISIYNRTYLGPLRA